MFPRALHCVRLRQLTSCCCSLPVFLVDECCVMSGGLLIISLFVVFYLLLLWTHSSHDWHVTCSSGFIVISAIYSGAVHSEMRQRSSKTLVLHITVNQHRTIIKCKYTRTTKTEQSDTDTRQCNTKVHSFLQVMQLWCHYYFTLKPFWAFSFNET